MSEIRGENKKVDVSLSFLEDWDNMGILPVGWNLAGVQGILVESGQDWC